MTTETFFLNDIREENYRQGLSSEEEAALENYLEEMAHGPADGEMDIDYCTCSKSMVIKPGFI